MQLKSENVQKALEFGIPVPIRIKSIRLNIDVICYRFYRIAKFRSSSRISYLYFYFLACGIFCCCLLSSLNKTKTNCLQYMCMRVECVSNLCWSGCVCWAWWNPWSHGVGGCDSKLVPTAWPDVGKPDSLLCGLREVDERHLMNPHSLRK